MATRRGLSYTELKHYAEQDSCAYVNRMDDFDTGLTYFCNAGGSYRITEANEKKGSDYYLTALQLVTTVVKDLDHRGPVVARDVPNGNGAKVYSIMRCERELYNLCRQGNWGLYELLPADIPRYFYCDIDCKFSDVEDEKLLKRLKKRDVVKDVTEAVAAVSGMEQRDVVVLKSFPDEEKLSVHCVFKDVSLANNDACKVFSQAVYRELIEMDADIYSKKMRKNQREDGRTFGLGVFDTVPYMSNQVWRVLKQTKVGSPRILKCISNHKGVERLGNAGIYENREEVEYFDVTELEKEQQEAIKRDFEKRDDGIAMTGAHSGHGAAWTGLTLVEGTPKPNYDDQNDFSYLLSCIPNSVDNPQPYNVWVAIGMALKNESTTETTDELRELWLKWTNKAYNNSQAESVRQQWRSFKRVKRGFTWRLLNNLASYYVPNPFGARTSKFISEVTELTAATLGNVDHEVYGSPFVAPYDLERYDFLLEKSFLGTGKTTAVKQLLDSGKYRRVLFLSCRIIFSYNILGEFSEYGFKNYKDCDTYDLSKEDRLICSVESIHRVGEAKYDLVVMDEIESLLNVLSSSTVSNKEQTEEALETVLVNSGKILGLDAFLSDRSVDFIREIRQLKHGDDLRRFDKRFRDVLVRQNTWKPGRRQAYEYEELTDFEDRLLEKLDDGKRVVVYASSYTYLDTLYGKLRDNFNVLFYNAKTGDEVKHNVRDVRTEWKKYQVVLYTPCISVGVNFDVADVFDSIFCYGVSTSANVRDVFQSLYRVRHTVSGELHYFLNDIKADRMMNKKSIRKRQREKNALYKALLVEKDSLPDSVRRCMWSVKLALSNYQEDSVSKSSYTKMFHYYLTVCNFWYTRVEKQEKQNDEKSEEGERGLTSYDEVPDIDSEELSEYSSKIKRSRATEKEKLAVDKFYLQQLLSGVDEKQKAGVWISWHNSGKKTQLKRLVYEVKGQIEKLEEGELKKKRGRDVHFINLCYPEIKKLLAVVGIESAHDTETVVQMDKIEEKAEELSAVVTTLKRKLGIVDQKLKAKNKQRKRQNNAVALKNDISCILQRWNGSKIVIAKQKMRRVEGKLTRVRGYKLALPEGFRDLDLEQLKGNKKVIS